jgi:hypothetical protein
MPDSDSRWRVSDPLARFARVSPSRGGEPPKAAGGRSHTARKPWVSDISSNEQMSKRLTDTAEEFAARLAWSWIELQSIIQTQNNIGRPDPQSDTV